MILEPTITYLTFIEQDTNMFLRTHGVFVKTAIFWSRKQTSPRSRALKTGAIVSNYILGIIRQDI